MTQQVDIGPSALKLHDGVFNSDHFYLNARNIDHDLSFDDLKLNDFIIKTHENDISQLNKEQNERLFPSKPPSSEKQKDIRTSHGLQSLINKIRQLKLTKHDIIMLFLNILMALTLIIVFLFLRQSSQNVPDPAEEILLMKRGEIFGGPGGEKLWNDGQMATLTFNDTITRVSATQSLDKIGQSLLLSLIFTYSNGKAGRQYGGINPIERVEKLDALELDPDEHIDQITVYEDGRSINNPSRDGKLTYLIVGIHFKTNRDQERMFGFANNKSKTESFPGYYLAYVEGKDGGFIDSLRFTWYKYHLKNSPVIQ